MSVLSRPSPHRARRIGSALFIPLIVWPTTWLLLLSTGWLTTYSHAWTQWISLFRPAVIELQIEGAQVYPTAGLAAQVRIGGSVLCQTEILEASNASTQRRQIRLPLRAFGPLEIRLATVDAQGCTQASGIGRLQAAGEESLALPIQLLPLPQKICPSTRSPGASVEQDPHDPYVAGQD